MPGKILKFSVAEGDSVRKNHTLAVVEAMKMENELKSPGDGTVKKICALAGDLVDTNKPLLEIEAGYNKQTRPQGFAPGRVDGSLFSPLFAALILSYNVYRRD